VAFIDLDRLTKALVEFADERQWQKFHTPKNLTLALVGEVGELAEIVQWLPEGHDFTAGERRRLGEELSDVLMYVVRLADVLGIDLDSAVTAKLARNAERYRADEVMGSSRKMPHRPDSGVDESGV
jgi:dCTP diphosphatase